MNQSNSAKSKRFFIASVAAMMATMLVTASVLAGCGGSSDGDNKETSVVTETQIVTRVVNGVFTDKDGNVLKDKDGQPMTAPSGTPDTDDKSQSSKSEKSESGQSSGSEKSESGKSDSSESEKSESSKSEKSESSKTESKSESSKSDNKGGSSGVKLGGKTYSVGDTVTCVYKVESPDAFINYQCTLYYDSDLLKVTNAKTAGDAKSGSVVNYNLDGKVKFNGINLTGYDYIDGGDFFTVTYEVVGNGTAEPELDFEIVTDMKDQPLVVNGSLKSSFKVSESYE